MPLPPKLLGKRPQVRPTVPGRKPGEARTIIVSGPKSAPEPTARQVARRKAKIDKAAAGHAALAKYYADAGQHDLAGQHAALAASSGAVLAADAKDMRAKAKDATKDAARSLLTQAAALQAKADADADTLKRAAVLH
jgi:hypothetical protein